MTAESLRRDLKRIASINAAEQAARTGRPKRTFEQLGSPTSRVMATDEVSMQETMAYLRSSLPELFKPPPSETDSQDTDG